ncbi:MAG: DUF4397 domain-containing protein [Crocinitomicaceae bacterium]
MKKQLFLLSAFCLGIALTNEVSAQARLQVIHNSADAAAATVDIRVDGTFPDASFDDLSFREATPFITVPAGTYTVTVNAASSTDASSPVYSQNLTVANGETYVVMAAGIVSGTGYNPGNTTAGFTYDVLTGAREISANGMMETDIVVFHGATDAPMVDIVDVTDPFSTGTIVDDASFGDFSSYLELPTLDYTIQVRTQDNTTVKEYQAPLQTAMAGGLAATVFASGFLDPSQNSNGDAFGLFVALADGSVIPLTENTTPTTARIQIVHNCAATDAAMVDVYVNDALVLDDFAFRTATPFIDAPAGTILEVDICASTSTDASSPLYTEAFTLNGGEKYVVVASGTVGTGTYTPATAFDLIAFNGARESSTTAGNVDVMVFHGATDAPAVDVNEMAVPAGTIVSNIAYGQNQGYLDLGASSYVLGIAPTSGSNIAQFQADLTSLADSAITVFASGFLDPAQNNNAAAFGLYVSLPHGGPLLMLPVSTLSVDENEGASFNVYPNPTHGDQVVIDLGTSTIGNDLEIRILDMNGKVVYFNDAITTNRVQMNLADFNKGIYLIHVQDQQKVSTQKLVIK